jgi:hypothetical protein
MIDFLDERFDIAEMDGGYYTKSDVFMNADVPFSYNTLKRFDIETSALWEKKCLKFIKLLRKYFSSDRVFLIKNYLTEKFGSYERKTCFDNIEEINSVNALIKKYYNFFQDNCPGINIIDISGSDICFTDSNFRHGRHPWHYNDEYSIRIAERICELI